MIISMPWITKTGNKIYYQNEEDLKENYPCHFETPKMNPIEKSNSEIANFPPKYL